MAPYDSWKNNGPDPEIWTAQEYFALGLGLVEDPVLEAWAKPNLKYLDEYAVLSWKNSFTGHIEFPRMFSEFSDYGKVLGCTQ